MPRFQIIRDGEGKPAYVHTDDGFMETSGPYREEEHGWMETQIDENDFPAIQIGDDTRMLVREVNRLRRELWHQTKMTDSYRGAAGF